MKPTSALRALLLAPALLALSACATMPKTDTARTGPFYPPTNVHAAAHLPENVRRIALLPCASIDPELTEATLREIDHALVTSLTGAARAEITPVSRTSFARLGGRAGLLSTDALPPQLLARVAADTGADAVAFVDVTSYSAYPPLRLGLRARLVELATPGADPLWAFDNIFSASNPAVINSARAHAMRRTEASTSPGDRSHAVLQNPVAFADYVADATWFTLPPR